MRNGLVPFGLVACLLLGGAGRLAWLEQNRGEQLRKQAQHQQTATYAIAAQRGEILDARGRVLAGTLRRPSVFADPGNVADVRFAAYSLGPVLGMNAPALDGYLKGRTDRRFTWLKRDLTDDELHGFLDLRASR